jgi:glutamate racemase
MSSSIAIRPHAPIGVFDSGLGGLTVLRAVSRALPAESMVYLGDTARVPYGTRSASTVIRYALGCGRMLVSRDIKLLVVACNTVSAVALDMLRVELDIPVLGVIEPGARAAAERSRSGRIGVLATSGTVASRAYPRAVAAVDSRAEVFQQAAPLLVPLAEEGWLDGQVPELVVERYLRELKEQQPSIDTLVLGCTHYPLLTTVIEAKAREVFDHEVAIVDSGVAAAAELSELLTERALKRPDGSGELTLMVTDRPAAFGRVASRFLGRSVEDLPIEQVDL